MSFLNLKTLTKNLNGEDRRKERERVTGKDLERQEMDRGVEKGGRKREERREGEN